ncbi:MAG: hypothetical protein ACJAZD_003155, partial [Ilumatobacter sp.]
VVAAIDPGTAVPKILESSGGGVAVLPDDATAFVEALTAMLERADRGLSMGTAGRIWVEREASPEAVGVAYHHLIELLAGRAP